MMRRMKSTRRGFLRGSIGAAVVGSACSHDASGTRLEKGTAPPEPRPAERVRVSTSVNGKKATLDVHPDDSALSMVREQLKLTGCKLACGHGACGACTMQLDGTPVAACLLPATSLHGREVTTVEGIANGKKLHPVQRAFMAEDGLQCGYCTPGFIVEAVAFHDAWRKRNGTKRPSRGKIADALSGHLCRCAAYDAIYRAVEGACTGRFDDGDPDVVPRYDAREKVTGEARYTVDVQLPGMLHARALHSPHAHARVTKLDWKKALAIPGVRAAVELLGQSRTIRYAGQEILAIAAVDERTADEALALVEIEYDERTPVIGIAAGKDPKSPAIYEKARERRRPPNASEGPLLPEAWEGNVRGPLELFSKHKGKAKRAVANAKSEGSTLAEGRYVTATQIHTTFEPHAAVAAWSGSDKLTVYLSTQGMSRMRDDIADRWELRRDDVEVITQYVGAGFGAKGTLQTEAVIAIELARAAGAPVRYARERRAEMQIGGQRPASEIDIGVAVDKAGDLAGVTAIAHSNSGPAVGHITGVLIRIIYPDAPKHIADYDVVTNAGPGQPFRGPGGPMAYFALESAIDDIAHQRGEDPLRMRDRWDPNPARQPLYAWVEEIDAWKNRGKAGADKGRWKRGIGLSFSAWFAFAEPTSRVQLDAGPDGLVASTASQDMGNGTRTVIADVIAREMGIGPRDVIVRIGHTKYVHGPQSAGSRTVSSLTPPCVHACEQLKEELVDAASRRWKLDGAVAGRGGVEHAGGMIPWAEVMKSTPPVTVVGRRRRDKGGYLLPPMYDIVIEKYVASAIQLMEVEVDTRLGKVRVTEAWGGYAPGRLVSPVLATGQAMGGMLQGIGYTLYEEARLDPVTGFLLTGGLEDYRLVGIGDIPKMHVHFHQRGYEKVRERSIGIGEIVTLGPPAAIGNAIFNATGWRPKELPIRPDRVLQGVRG
jgi:xanthine dehydrogenase YagR molybdenum-binding subunit